MSSKSASLVIILGVAAACFALATLLATPALAQGPGVNLTQLAAQVAADHATIAALQNTVNAQQATINNLQTTVNNQATLITALQAKTAPISIQNGVGTGTELFFTGVNLHVVNGLGATNGEPSNPVDIGSTVTNGLGNLIIGYNVTRTVFGFGGPDDRAGSHNLILGDGNNYSSYGGIIGGALNSISGGYASIITGSTNQASAFFASVIAGTSNTASGEWAVVAGGTSNTSSGEASAVLGGASNTANGLAATVTGGVGNIASGNGSIAP